MIFTLFQVVRRMISYTVIGGFHGIAPGAIAGVVCGAVFFVLMSFWDPVAAMWISITIADDHIHSLFSALLLGTVTGLLFGAAFGGVCWAVCFLIYALCHKPSGAFQSDAPFRQSQELTFELCLLGAAAGAVAGISTGALVALAVGSPATDGTVFSIGSQPMLVSSKSQWLLWTPYWRLTPLLGAGVFYGAVYGFITGTLLGIIWPRTGERWREVGMRIFSR